MSASHPNGADRDGYCERRLRGKPGRRTQQQGRLLRGEERPFADKICTKINHPRAAPIDEGQLPAPERSGKIEFEVGVQDRPIAGAHCKQGGRWGQQPIGTRKLLRGPVAFLGPAERVAARNGEGRAGGANYGAVRQFADWAQYRVYPFTATCQPLRVSCASIS
jgi:hypothetical protein